MKNIKKVLFIPVSSPTGAGEYYRCLTIAEALIRRQPRWECHFCLNRHANVMHPNGFQYHLLKDSPTLDNAGVNRVLEEIQPDVVIFDNTLRYAQVKKAALIAGTVIYTSSRPKKRRKGFSLRKHSYINRHWVIAPPSHHQFSFLENLFLRLTRERAPKFFAAILPKPLVERRIAMLSDYSFPREGYVLFTSGGGGGTIRKSPTDCVFQEAARRYHQKTGLPTLFVAGPLSRVEPESINNRLEYRSVSPEQMSDLIDGAALVVSGGGSIVQQVLALQKPCLAIPAGGKDQSARIEHLKEELLISTCAPDAYAMADEAVRLMSDKKGLEQLCQKTERHCFENGLDQALDELEQMVLYNKNDMSGLSRSY